MSQKHLYELPELRPVSPIYTGPGYEERLPDQPQPHSESARAPWLSEVSLGDHDISEARTPFGSVFENESRAPMLDSRDGLPVSRRDYTHKTFLQPKRQRFLPTWLLAIAAVATSIFSIVYSYTVMVNENAVPQALSLSPGKTVLVVNILSHLVAFLCWNLFCDASEAMRWALACRPDGVLLTSFLALSRATPLSGVAYLCAVKGAHGFWAVSRLVSIAVITVLGLVLITDVTFKNVYTSTDNHPPLDVIAGLAPLDVRYVPFVPERLLSIYATGYSVGFLTDPRFVTNVAPVGCSGRDCVSVFMPGGLHLVRLDNGHPDATLFRIDIPDDYTSVIIDDAPGYQVEFSPMDVNYKFQEQDCHTYSTKMPLSNYGLRVCLASVGYQLLVGWTVCPSGTGDCGTNSTWTMKDPMDETTSVAWYKRTATVAYDSRNFSILSIESIKPPQQTYIEASTMKMYFDIVMKDTPPQVNISQPEHFADIATSFTLQYGVGWLLRLYQDDFTSFPGGSLIYMQSFLAVPLQFSTMIWSQNDAIFNVTTLPADLKTTARWAKVSYRAIIQAWTVYAFGSMAAVITFAGIACLAWVHFWGPQTPNSSMFPEIDITSKCTGPTTSKVTTVRPSSEKSLSYNSTRIEMSEECLEDLEFMTRKNGLGNGMSRAVVNGIVGRRIYCGAYQGPTEGEQNHIVIVTEKNKVGPLNLREKYS